MAYIQDLDDLVAVLVILDGSIVVSVVLEGLVAGVVILDKVLPVAEDFVDSVVTSDELANGFVFVSDNVEKLTVVRFVEAVVKIIDVDDVSIVTSSREVAVTGMVGTELVRVLGILDISDCVRVFDVLNVSDGVRVFKVLEVLGCVKVLGALDGVRLGIESVMVTSGKFGISD